MAENKRYYYLQMPEDFFSSERITRMRTIAGGDTFTIIYLKMQLQALQNNGVLEFDKDCEIAEAIAEAITEDSENVRLAMDYLSRNNLLEVRDNGDCYMPYAQMNGNSIAASSIRSKKSRAKKQSEDDCKGQMEEQEETDEEFFERIWKLYPRKEGKGSVSKTKKGVLHRIGYDEIARCVERYKQTRQGKDPKYTMHGSTFFNSGYVDYLDANYQDTVSSIPVTKSMALKEWINE